MSERERQEVLRQERRWAAVCVALLAMCLVCWCAAGYLVTVAVTKARGAELTQVLPAPHTAVVVDQKAQKVYRNPMAIYEDRDACENAIAGIGTWLDLIAKLDRRTMTEETVVPYPKEAELALAMSVADLVVVLMMRDQAMPALTISCAAMGKGA